MHLDRYYLSTNSFGPCRTILIIIPNVGQVKSFVDDLHEERGAVSMRVFL